MQVFLDVYKRQGQGNPGILKLGGPVDIVFLVKTGAQFYHAEHIFAVFRGAYQGRDDLAGRCDTVQCNLCLLYTSYRSLADAVLAECGKENEC